ncbi:MAG TPA: glutaredoxin family protein [Terrimesophilobacter sp.]|nr:glutaredoxin family protein [Terrimesophilobacter sp.]
MANTQLTIIGKPDCHLCDVASGVIDGVIAELGPAAEVEVEKLSILDDAELHERYWEQIPVILIDGVEHAHWHVDPAALRAAILGAS